MNKLIMPDPFAGACVQAHQCVSEQSRARPSASVPVVSRRGDGQKDITERVVRRHHRPYIRVARVLPRVIIPGLVSNLALLCDRVERPEELAGSYVEAALVSWRHLLRIR